MILYLMLVYYFVQFYKYSSIVIKLSYVDCIIGDIILYHKIINQIFDHFLVIVSNYCAD